ncbi:oligomeric golgi complex component, COG2-domain-containing protein [Cyathus striatus]|nr:oligomeric golgi complex component, COG2-domain-containing protein [Cyathus striatus]
MACDSNTTMEFSPRISHPSSSPHEPHETDTSKDLSERYGSASPLADEDNANLPEYIPLSHNNKYLSADIFNVEDFLLSRVHITLPDLRSELRDYLSFLNEELARLISDDYRDFISLSTNLRDEDARKGSLMRPLRDLRQQESAEELRVRRDGIQEMLDERATLREQEMAEALEP